MSGRGSFRVGGQAIRAGTTRDFRLKVSESYTGDTIVLPVRVIRAPRPGPVIFLSAAVHGDELNGTGIIRELIFGRRLPLHRGILICLPVVNVFGFENHTRYLPDRRDLNRSFPGTTHGSLASRVAHTIFTEIVERCDYGIDLHTAAVRHTNFPNVRADLGDPEVHRLATAFGCEVIVNNAGPVGSLRRAACAHGCPTIVLEAGEVWKVEPGVLAVGTRGVINVLVELGMVTGERLRPPYQVVVRKTAWVRAELGGILRFHVAPGDLISNGQTIATSASIFGNARSTIRAPVDGIVMGMTTLPAVKPGEPICHVAIPNRRLSTIQRALERGGGQSQHQRLREDLATSFLLQPDGRPARKPSKGGR